VKEKWSYLWREEIEHEGGGTAIAVVAAAFGIRINKLLSLLFLEYGTHNLEIAASISHLALIHLRWTLKLDPTIVKQSF